jgi:ADP-ribose pyrophosphatase YjhB (NUDIX family)
MTYTFLNDNDYMSRNQRPKTVRFQPKQVSRLKGLLGRKTVAAYHEAGCTLNAILVGRPSHGSNTIAAVAEQIGCSANMIHKLRMLARVFTQSDVQTAVKRRVPWHWVIQMVFLARLAGGNAKSGRKSMSAECQRLIRSYPFKRSGMSKWKEEFARFKARCLKGLDDGPKARQLSEVRQAVLFRLKEAMERMKDRDALLSKSEKSTAKELRRKLGNLRDEIEALYARATEELRATDDQSVAPSI